MPIRWSENSPTVPYRTVTSRCKPWAGGSDFTGFLNHLGIASLNLGFDGEGENDGIYHSRYDSFDHFARFGDPTFEYEVALAQVSGHIVHADGRRASAAACVSKISALLSIATSRSCISKSLRSARPRSNSRSCSARMRTGSPPIRPIRSHLRSVFRTSLILTSHPWIEAAKRLRHSARAYEAAYEARAAGGLSIPADRLREINALMATMEQRTLDEVGLPGRPWYRNMIQAPGVLTGYATKTIPGVREALEARNWHLAEQYAVITAKVLDNYRGQLDRLTALLGQGRS